MDNFKNFIHQNRDQFDGEEPLEGHFERFEKKLNKSTLFGLNKSDINVILRIAAIVIVVFTAGVFTYNYVYHPAQMEIKNTNGMTLSDLSPEYKEVEFFFQTNVNSKLIELEKLNCEKGNIQKSEIIQEITKLDTVYKYLQTELKKNYNDQRIINAMINNYQTRVDFLNKVIFQIKNNC